MLPSMHGSCPDCGAVFDASTPPALVALILEHPCDRRRLAGFCPDVDPDEGACIRVAGHDDDDGRGGHFHSMGRFARPIQ